MNRDTPRQTGSDPHTDAERVDEDARAARATPQTNRTAQRHHKESQVAQLSAADIEESPRMDRGDSAQGAGESLAAGSKPGSGMQRGALDAQYGTAAAQQAPKPGTGTEQQPATAATTSSPAPGSGRAEKGSGGTENSSGSERDTMTDARPGGRA